jgi:hypothetical protein
MCIKQEARKPGSVQDVRWEQDKPNILTIATTDGYVQVREYTEFTLKWCMCSFFSRATGLASLEARTTSCIILRIIVPNAISTALSPPNRRRKLRSVASKHLSLASMVLVSMHV